MELETAQRILNTTKRQKEARYMVRRPSLSLKDDHQSGNIDMLSMYNEIERFAMVADVPSSFDTCDKDADNHTAG